MADLYRHVPVLDSGARGATTSFVQRGQGDLLLAWENEAYLAVNELGKEKLEIVVPSLSILAEPPVSVVDRKKTRRVAEAYLKYLYSPEGQEIAARNYCGPRDKKVAAKYGNRCAKVKLVTIDDTFGGWRKAHKALCRWRHLRPGLRRWKVTIFLTGNAFFRTGCCVRRVLGYV